MSKTTKISFMVVFLLVLAVLVVVLAYTTLDRAVSSDHARQALKYKSATLAALVELSSDLLVGTPRRSIEAAIESRHQAQAVDATEKMLTVENIAFRFDDGVLVEVRLWSELPEELLD